MIVEHEVIEQIEEDEHGWSLDRVCALIRSHGKDPFDVLDGMWRARLVVFRDSQGDALPDYRCNAVLRAGDEQEQIRVHVA